MAEMDLDKPQFINITQFHKQPFPTACHHQGPCGGKAQTMLCHCSANRTICFTDCRCDDATCQIKYPGCRCVGSSCTSQCLCRRYRLDCIPGRCICINCSNTAASKRASHVYVSKSPVHGYGLFAAESISAGSCVGVYDGVLVEDSEYDGRPVEPGDDHLTCFSLTKSRYMKSPICVATYVIQTTRSTETSRET